MSRAKLSELEGKCTGVLEEGENIKLKVISLHELWLVPVSEREGIFLVRCHARLNRALRTREAVGLYWCAL